MKQFLVLLLLVVYVATTSRAYAISPPEKKEMTCAADFPRHLGHDLKETFWNRWHLLTIGLGIGALAGLHEADPSVQRSFQPGRPLGRHFDDVMKWGANPFVLAGGSLVSLAITELLMDAPKAARTSGAIFEALMLTESMTFALQLATHRGRPDASNNMSFPSGHTSGAFAIAAVTEGLYGPWFGVPAFALAGLVGASRLDSNKHVLTDVAAGALLGTLVGLGTAQFHQQEYPKYFLAPTFGDRTAGLSLVHSF